MRLALLLAAACGLLTVSGCTWNPGRGGRLVPPGRRTPPPAAGLQAPTPILPTPADGPLHGPGFPGAGLEAPAPFSTVALQAPMPLPPATLTGVIEEAAPRRIPLPVE